MSVHSSTPHAQSPAFVATLARRKAEAEASLLVALAALLERRKAALTALTQQGHVRHVARSAAGATYTADCTRYRKPSLSPDTETVTFTVDRQRKVVWFHLDGVRYRQCIEGGTVLLVLAFDGPEPPPAAPAALEPPPPAMVEAVAPPAVPLSETSALPTDQTTDAPLAIVPAPARSHRARKAA